VAWGRSRSAEHESGPAPKCALAVPFGGYHAVKPQEVVALGHLVLLLYVEGERTTW
jgi:hypothetical protein